MYHLRICLAFCLCLWSLTAFSQQYERDYQELIHAAMGGEMEVSVPGGRVDILTDTFAIEIEFAHKWKNAIGQSLWYGLQTNVTPGIVLIKRERSDNKYVIQLGSALAYAGLSERIRVWVYPDDF